MFIPLGKGPRKEFPFCLTRSRNAPCVRLELDRANVPTRPRWCGSSQPFRGSCSNNQRMSITTKIQWCDSTCNPTMGCAGCELWNPRMGERSCYAGLIHLRYGGVAKGYSPTFEELTYWPGRMDEAARWADLTGTARRAKPWLDGFPRLIFISAMSDALSAEVPFDFLEREISCIVASPRRCPPGPAGSPGPTPAR